MQKGFDELQTLDLGRGNGANGTSMVELWDIAMGRAIGL